MRKFGPTPARPPAPTLHQLPLLDALLRESLDPAYAEAAARRRERERSGAARQGAAGRPQAHLLAVFGVVLVAVVAGLAIGQQRASAPDAAKARTNLIREITSRTALVDFLTKSEAILRDQTGAKRDQLLNASREGAALANQIRGLDAATGATVLKGSGIVVRMADAKADTTSADGSVGGSAGRIQDRDIQEVVNQLWASGAKGIAINGIRLTAQTAIRTAGDAILVDFRAQSSPYVIDVVGTDAKLQSTFNHSAVAARFSAWTQLYGLGFSVSRDRSITLPAAAPTAARHATAVAPLTSKSSAPSGEPSP